MTYLTKLASPLGPLSLASGGEAVTGLWLAGQKYFAAGLEADAEERPDLPVFRQAEAWLNAYFEKRDLPPLPPLAPGGSEFRQTVWKLLLEIPFGKTTTYGALAERLKAAGTPASPQAVGGAVGHNPISILIPCHRVVGADGSLTGYAGGVDKKRFLLELEGADLVYTPKTGDGAEKFPCPCCGYKTFPVPKEEAAAYICPVCFWENDVFSPGEDQPSDENRGITLNQGREALRKLGAVRKELARYVRKPLPEEIP